MRRRNFIGAGILFLEWRMRQQVTLGVWHFTTTMDRSSITRGWITFSAALPVRACLDGGLGSVV
jgi:hypothetical protein